MADLLIEQLRNISEGVQAFQRNQSVWCVPSQNGGVLVCLHWHKAISFFSFNENSTGSIPVPWWDPSQNGWSLERPH
jgi:hypothetical protein